MTFKFPLDSGPATPNKSRGLFGDRSTTPSGIPPSSAHSFTPQGPPPSTIYGSSKAGSRTKLDFGDSLFTKSGNFGNDSIFGSSVASSDYRPQPRKKNATFAPADSYFNPANSFGGQSFGGNSEFNQSQMSEDIEEETEEEEMEEEEDLEPEDGVGDDTMDLGKDGSSSRGHPGFLDSYIGNTPAPSTNLAGSRKSIYTNPDNAKRPKLHEPWANRSPLAKSKLTPKASSAVPSIARDMAARSRLAHVNEPSNLILDTEDEICRMWDTARLSEYEDSDFDAILSEVAGKLAAIWQLSADQSGVSRPYVGADIGPGDKTPNLVKASFLGSFMLQIHHPPLVTPQPGSNALIRAPSQNPMLARQPQQIFTPMPKMLLDWLNTNHVTGAADIESLRSVEPNPTASPNFWEIINAAVLRGHLSEVAEVLRSADFNYARSALEDGLPQPGYRGVQLQNIQRCINKARQLLDSCPSVQGGNWDVKSAEWESYRKRIIAALTDLEEFAEGEEPQVPEPASTENRFQAVNFGLTSSTGSNNFFTQSARMAGSRVPWAIYQSLKALYQILLGDADAIASYAQDWVEASIALTAWWDGEDDDEILGQGARDLKASTASNNLARSRGARTQAPRPVDVNPAEAYLNRLSLAFSSMTDETVEGSFRLNSLSNLEVGLASIFEGNTESALALLQGLSLTIASAVAEVASAGSWFEGAAGAKPLSKLLNENDLMVLSYGQDTPSSAKGLRKDDVLSAYATGLFERSSINSGVSARTGWEIALEVLSRLDDAERMQKSVSELLDKLPLDSADQMDKVVLLCTELGLDKEGRRVSERYGDLTVSNSEDYGLALVCYARAHSRRKVKSVVDLLISYSLVQSRAYPVTGDLDEQLRSLIAEPKTCLSAIASVDDEAAQILQFYFSGYATLRRFYDIRDEAVGAKEGQLPRLKPLARRRAAAQALVAVISSAADSIYGGLYDPDRDSAVQVDGLLSLLGEALVLINQPTPVLSMSQQFTILSAIEDLETVTPRVYAQCEECFRSTLIEYHHSSSAANGSTGTSPSLVLPPSPRALLKKSVTSLTASSTFSFIGSDMVGSARTRSGSGSGSTSSSAVLVPHPRERKSPSSDRGWDWRAGLSEEARGEDVLRILRLGLARGLSFGALGSV
ncbi:hypothetical protein ASPZODRAFT_62552 [Penicilliopsis zonata CBS 506.65]|uniref:Nuclear pore complex protein Nup85 n=1 Tax=Penicilliopsis zonata CBS 506.65 TaxID=1073090 RepID=A0A1L9SM35_9EURO|nr:hypothetical protein ASPZODRAFT_62552 [Penicilliopsis zonata CBS 506.65]OJJ48114.1 hypothetical protein ASPZODRAFT_62552 [Penicilliopsis zonata CBS 506.65]